MGHTGKHIIDAETGLCVICDQDAIDEVNESKRPGKHYYYANGNDGSTYRSSHDEAPYAKDRYAYETRDEMQPRYVRKIVYPPPTVQPRRVLYEQPIEQPIVIRRKVVRREHSPPEEVILRRRPPPPRPSTLYYDDPDHQMIPHQGPPHEEHPRRFIVRNRQPPPERAVHVIRQPSPPLVRKVPVVRQPARTPTPTTRVVNVRRPPAQTPPPPASEQWHTVPRRETHSDTQIVEREQRMPYDDRHPPQPFKPEMFHLKAPHDRPHHQSLSEFPVYQSRTPTPQPTFQANGNRRPNRVEPMKQRTPPPSEPTVIKRVYKKLAPGSNQPPADHYEPNENQPYSSRRPANYTPPPKQYQSSDRDTNGNNRSSEQMKNPTIFYIRNTDHYE